MTGIPEFLLVHTVTVEPLTGRSSTGKLYGASFPLKCMAQGARRQVRNSLGDEVLSTLTLYAAPGQAATVPAGSRITWAGVPTEVIAAADRDSGGLAADAEHTEVMCQ